MWLIVSDANVSGSTLQRLSLKVFEWDKHATKLFGRAIEYAVSYINGKGEKVALASG